MDGKCGEMYASGCIIFGERRLGSVTVSVSVSVTHGNLYKAENENVNFLGNLSFRLKDFETDTVTATETGGSGAQPDFVKIAA